MPSKSKAQHRLMEAVKHNPKFARKVGIPQSVGVDYVAADKRAGKYARGGAIGQTVVRPRPVPGTAPTALPDTLRRVDQMMGQTVRKLNRIKERR